MGTNKRRSCSVIMDHPDLTLKAFTLAAISTILAACGERGVDESLKAEIEPAPETKPAAVETVEGAWFYKDSNGYPWAGFGPPRSEALFVIACREGQVVFQHAARHAADMSIELAEGKQEVAMTPNGDNLPMSEGALPANDPFIHLLAQSHGPIRVVLEDAAMTMPSDSSYRLVVNACIDGVAD